MSSGYEIALSIADLLLELESPLSANELGLESRLGPFYGAPEAPARRLRVMALKGAALLEGFYGNPGLRALGDLDLLVPAPEVAAAVRVLTGRGYAPGPRLNPQGPASVAHHIYLVPGPGATAPVEIHWRLTAARTVAAHGGAEGWERAVPATVAGVAVAGLCPEDLLLHLCLHVAYGHEFTFGLRPFCDIATVAAAGATTLDWPAVAARAQLWQADRGTYLALRLARDWLAAPIPPAVLAALQPAEFDESVLAVARTRVLAEPPTSCPHLCSPFLRMRRETRWTVKLGAVLRQVFVDRPRRGAHYGVAPDSPAIYLFYYLPRLGDVLLRYLPLVGRLRHDGELQG
jgi:hypothetical protein